MAYTRAASTDRKLKKARSFRCGWLTLVCYATTAPSSAVATPRPTTQASTARCAASVAIAATASVPTTASSVAASTCAAAAAIA